MDIKAKKKMTKEAREFISKKIKFLMEEEGMEQKQAIAVAYSMAEKEGYKVPKKTKAEEIESKDIVINAENSWEEVEQRMTKMILRGDSEETIMNYFMDKFGADREQDLSEIYDRLNTDYIEGKIKGSEEIESKDIITAEWLNEEWDMNLKSLVKLFEEGKLKLNKSKAIKNFVNYNGKDEDEKNELAHEVTGEFLYQNDIDVDKLKDSVYDSLMECVEMYAKKYLKAEEIESKDIITEHILGMFQEYAEKVCANNKDVGFDEIREMWAKEDKDKIVSFLYEKNKAQELVIDKLDGILASCGITLNEFDINNIIAVDAPPPPTSKPPAGQRWTKSVKDDGTVEWVLTKI